MRSVLAGDLGGTKCRFALVTEDFAVHGAQRVDTVRDRGPFLANMRDAIGAALEAAALKMCRRKDRQLFAAPLPTSSRTCA